MLVGMNAYTVVVVVVHTQLFIISGVSKLLFMESPSSDTQKYWSMLCMCVCIDFFSYSIFIECKV